MLKRISMSRGIIIKWRHGWDLNPRPVGDSLRPNGFPDRGLNQLGAPCQSENN